jgi:porphobilinogen synthase
MHQLPLRLKRMRRTPYIRDMLQETRLHMSQFIAPLFISEKATQKKAIDTMPGHYQLTLKDLPAEIDELVSLGIKAVLLFGIPQHKDAQGHASVQLTGIIQKAIQVIRNHHSDILIIADVCLCEYTDHGHCGILTGETIHNDKTLAQLAAQAVSYAQAGADWVAPSSNTDGMVKALRVGLDNAGFENTAILSYAVKYASSLYGPFREAAEGAPQFGDRKTYQMNPANVEEAIREAMLDVREDADLLMVKPAMHYLDVIHRIKQTFPEIPLCAYQVSGEFAMIKLAARQGMFAEAEGMQESLLAIKRAGADLIVTYFAKELGKLLKRSDLTIFAKPLGDA